MEEKKGNERNYSRLREAVDDVTEAIADVWHRKRYRDIVSFDEILQYAYDEQKKYAQIEAFVISVKKNYDPQNENDQFIIIQALLAGDNQPISFDGEEAESRMIHTRTIDKKFLDMLDGAETKIFKL